MKLLITITILLSTTTIMGQNFHTNFKYDDSIGKGITIQNSYPKGGQKYTSPNGKEYVFVIFWTCITNDTEANIKVEIDFNNDSFMVPSSPNVNFNLYLPKDEMTLAKASLPNYGLDLKSFLDKNMDRPSGVITCISPKTSHLFYTVVISDKGINGVVRAGFELQKEDLIYKINNYQINCGRIVFIK